MGILVCSASLVGQEADKELDSIMAKIQSGTLGEGELQQIGWQCPNTRVSVERQELTFSKDTRLSVVQAFSTSCYERALIFFQKTASGWHHFQTLLLSSHYGEQPTVTFPELIEPGQHEILVRGEIADWGTGNLQKNMSIYKLAGDHFELIFDAPETVHIQVGLAKSLYRLEQKSTFDLIRIPQSKAITIDEKQVITKGRLTLTRYRGCVWRPEIFRYRCTERAE